MNLNIVIIEYILILHTRQTLQLKTRLGNDSLIAIMLETTIQDKNTQDRCGRNKRPPEFKSTLRSFVWRGIGSHIFTQHWASQLNRVSQLRADLYSRGTYIPFTSVLNESNPLEPYSGLHTATRSGRKPSVACRVDCFTSLYKADYAPREFLMQSF